MATLRPLNVVPAAIPTVCELIAQHQLTQEDLSVKAPHDLLVHIANRMSNWKVLVPFLGLRRIQREDIEQKSGEPQEQRLLVLETWNEKNGRDATYFKLVETFYKAERRDLVEEVCDFFVKQKNKAVQSTQRTRSQRESEALETDENDTELQQMPPVFTVQESVQPDDDTPLLEPEVHDESSATMTNQEPKLTRGAKICRCSFFLICCSCYAVLLAIPIVFLCLGFTVYAPPVLLITTERVVNKYTVLLGKFDSFYIESVTFSIIENGNANAQFYMRQCQDLKIFNRSVLKNELLPISQHQTYPIIEQYLVEGSTFTYRFEFNLQNATRKEPAECIAYVYTFRIYTFYLSFLEHGIKTDFDSEYCLTLDPEPFTEIIEFAHQTHYYLVGLYIPDMSPLKSVKAEIAGNEHYFFIDNAYSPDCVIEEHAKTSCTFRFEKTHDRDPSNDICILASTPDNGTQIQTYPHSRDEVESVREALLGLGFSSIALPIFCCACVCFSLVKLYNM